jgi:hypothetical protein
MEKNHSRYPLSFRRMGQGGDFSMGVLLNEQSTECHVFFFVFNHLQDLIIATIA